MKYGMRNGKVSSHEFELVVGQDDCNAESMCNMCTNDSFDMLDAVSVVHIVKFTNCTKLDMFQDSH